MKNKRFVKTILLIFLLSANYLTAQNKNWTLEDCVNYALKNNISIKNSILDAQLAQTDKLLALGSFLPAINASASHSWNIGLNQDITTGILQNQTTQNTAVGLNASLTLFDGLQNQNKLRRSKLAIMAASYQLSKMKDDVSLNVANAFLQILFNIENLKVQNEQLAINQKQFSRSQELVNAGSVPRGDLLDIKATVASNNQNVILAQNNLLISKLSLAQLLQLDDFKNFDVSQDNYELQKSDILKQSPESIYQKAREERTELKISRANLEIAQKDLKISRGAYQPKLSAFYNFNTRAGYSDQVVGYMPNTHNPTTQIGYVDGTGQSVLQPNFSPVLGKASPVFDQFSQYKGNSYGLQLNIPVFNGFSARSNVARYRVALEKSKIAMQQSELDLQRNVYMAFTNATGAMNAYESAIVALESRFEAYNFSKEKMNVGLMTAFDFNQSQTLYVNAQSEVLRTKYDYIFKIKILEYYFGIPIISNK